MAPISQSKTQWNKKGTIVNGVAIKKGYVSQLGKPGKKVTGNIKIATATESGKKAGQTYSYKTGRTVSKVKAKPAFAVGGSTGTKPPRTVTGSGLSTTTTPLAVGNRSGPYSGGTPNTGAISKKAAAANKKAADARKAAASPRVAEGPYTAARPKGWPAGLPARSVPNGRPSASATPSGKGILANTPKATGRGLQLTMAALRNQLKSAETNAWRLRENSKNSAADKAAVEAATKKINALKQAIKAAGS